MPTLRAYVGNCTMSGEDLTHHTDGSWIRDKVSFQCGHRKYCFRQHSELISAQRNQLNGVAIESSVVEVENVSPVELDAVLSDLDAICWLLTFALQSRVIRYGYEFPDESTANFHAARGVAVVRRPPFDPGETATIRGFVEAAFYTYKTLASRRSLPVVFDYLVQCELPGLVTEVRLIALFVTLENLKDTYARDSGIPYAKGYYRKVPLKRGHLGDTYSFQELLTMMLSNVGMSVILDEVKDLRNMLIHSGLTKMSSAEQWAMYESIQNITREYVLRLLGYRGSFLSYGPNGGELRTI